MARILLELQPREDPVGVYLESTHARILDRMKKVYDQALLKVHGKLNITRLYRNLLVDRILGECQLFVAKLPVTRWTKSKKPEIYDAVWMTYCNAMDTTPFVGACSAFPCRCANPDHDSYVHHSQIAWPRGMGSNVKIGQQVIVGIDRDLARFLEHSAGTNRGQVRQGEYRPDLVFAQTTKTIRVVVCVLVLRIQLNGTLLKGDP